MGFEDELFGGRILVKSKMVEYSEGVKENVKVGTCDGRSEVGRNIPGVNKEGNRWHAGIRHPKLKTEVYLGHYSSPEEAASVVKKKKAEYEDTFRGEDRVNVEICRDGFEGRKLPCGVYRSGYRRWQARIWHRGLKSLVNLGTYNSVEEAAVAADNKRAEFRKMYPCRMGVKSDCKDDDKLLIGDVKMSAHVKELDSGKWEARISHPVSRDIIWLETYDTAEEAIRSLNNRKNLLSAKRKKVECDECEILYKARPDCEVIDALVTLECDLGYSCPTSVLGAGNLNNITVDDKLRHGVSDIPDKLEYMFGHSPPSSIVEPESSTAHVDDRCVMGEGNQQKTVSASSDFDEAMSSGFINEYGLSLGKYSELDEYTFGHSSQSSIVDEPESSNAHVDERSVISKGNEQKTFRAFDFDDYWQLLGKDSELDEQMRFSLPDEDVAASGWY